MVFSGFSQYVANPESISEGGGTYGAILTMTCSIDESIGTFTISKTDGTPFSSSGTMYLDAMPNGAVYWDIRSQNSVNSGDLDIVLTDNFSNWENEDFPVKYKAELINSGTSYVGDIYIEKNWFDPPSPIFPTCGTTSVPTSVTFTWTEVYSAEGYQIEVGTSTLNWNENNGFTPGYTVHTGIAYNGNTHYDWNSAQPETTYYYTIRGLNYYSNPISDYSTPCQFTTAVASCSLPVPTGVVANVVSPYEIDLSWDNIPNASMYKIYDFGNYKATSYTNSYNDSGLTPGSNHCYTVSTCCSSPNCTDESSPCVDATTPNNTTFIISGKTKKANGEYIQNATVSFSGINGSQNLASVISSSDGNYIRNSVPYSWSGNVTATKTGFTFETIAISSVTSDLPNTHIIGTPVLSGPDISISPTSLDFGDVKVGSNSVAQTLTIT